MGLASSQARMLLLTARKSDLEYRAQMISQRKINLAMQTQQLATNYTRAMSNRQMDFVYYTNGNTQDVVTEKLSYKGIMAETSAGSFLVTTPSGQFVVTGSNETELNQSRMNVAMKMISAGMVQDKDGKTLQLKDFQVERNAKNDQGEEIKGEDGQPVKETVLDYSAMVNACLSKMKTVPAASNADYFQSALRNGSLFLRKAEMETRTDDEGNVKQTVTSYNVVSWGSLDTINDTLNTSDDAVAKAEYESKSLVLSNQDKMLDLELNQIQTQHKAIETEYDSVKKVIEKNIDVSYKIFA